MKGARPAERLSGILVNSPKKMLKKAKNYAILMELQDGKLNFQVTIDSGEEPYVAFGPDFVKRVLADSVPVINLRGQKSDYEYAGAGA